jgi:hypothetical protein
MVVLRFYPIVTRAEYDVASISELVLFDSDAGRANLEAARKKLTGVKQKKIVEAAAEAAIDIEKPREDRKIAFFLDINGHDGADDDTDMRAEKISTEAADIDECEIGAGGGAGAGAMPRPMKRQRTEKVASMEVGSLEAANFSAVIVAAHTVPLLPTHELIHLPTSTLPLAASAPSDLRSRTLSLKTALHARAVENDASGLVALLKGEECMNLRVTVELLSETKLLDVIKPLQNSTFSIVREAATEVVQLFKGLCKGSMISTIPVVRPATVAAAAVSALPPAIVVPVVSAPVVLALAPTLSSSATTPRIATDSSRLPQPTTPQRAFAIAIIRELFGECIEYTSGLHEVAGDVTAATTSASIDRVCSRLASILEQSILEQITRTTGTDGASTPLIETIIERIEDDTQASSVRARYRRLLAKCAHAFYGTPAAAALPPLATSSLETRLSENAPKLRKILSALVTKSGEVAEREAVVSALPLLR